MEDYGKRDREALLRPTPEQSRERKLRAALDHLGERYVCHKSNRVKKLDKPVPYVKRRGLDLV